MNNFAFLLLIIIVLNLRKSFEFEDASSLQSLYPSSPTENGTESQHKFGSKSTLEENAYEDIVGKTLLQNMGSQQDVEWLWAGHGIAEHMPCAGMFSAVSKERLNGD